MASNLRNFRIDDDSWEAFKALCQRSGTNASEALQQFIARAIAADSLESGNTAGPSLGDIEKAIEPLRDELSQLRESLGKSIAA